MSSKTKTIATKEEATPALVPKLRFPEFQDAWEMIPIGEKVDLLSGYPFDGPEISQDSSGVRLLRGINITEGRIRHTPEIDRYYASETEGLEKFRVRVNDLVIGMDGSKVGKNSALISDDDADALLIQRVARLRTSSSTLIQFIFQQINSTLFHSYVDKVNTSSGIPHISAKQIKDFTVGFPSPAEQQKIAECLSSVDELMAAQARRVDTLKTHKKGLMHQLFPREGETQPRLRFPGFQNAGEWSEGRLADIATVLQGYGFPERHQGQKSGDYPFYKVSDISRSLAAGKVFIEESANYINESLLKELRAKPIPEGTTVFAKIGEAIRSNRRAITTLPCLIDNNAAGVKRIKGKATDMFIYLLMEQISLIDHAGGVVPAVNKSAIEEIVVKFPEPDEQERIASCLSSLDALITAETQKLEALKTHKRGLMQQLFPSPQEVAA